MTFKILVEAVDEKLASIASILTRIEEGGDTEDLRNLGLHLIDAMGLFQRNPGIEAAADDLHAAAAALIMDSAARSQPVVRKLRIFKDAHLRFRNRLGGAAERVGPYEHLVVQVYPMRQAA
jgi:hypothetical protein